MLPTQSKSTPVQKSGDAHSELVQNFRCLFRDASPFSLRGSIQERKEEIERAITMRNALQQMSELGSSGGGLRLAVDEDKRLDRRIEGNRAVVAAMRELHGKVRAKMWRRRKEARDKRKRAKAMERREKLAAQALGEYEGSPREEKLKGDRERNQEIGADLVDRPPSARRTPGRDSI